MGQSVLGIGLLPGMEGQTTAHNSEVPCLPQSYSHGAHSLVSLLLGKDSPDYKLSGRSLLKQFLWGASDGGLATPPNHTTLLLPGMDGQVEVQKGDPCLLFLWSIRDLPQPPFLDLYGTPDAASDTCLVCIGGIQWFS